MKCHQKRELSKREWEALKKVVNQETEEWFKNHRLDIDKIVLYAMMAELGLDVETLKKFYERFIVIEDELVEMFEGMCDSEFVADSKLQDAGINVDAWYQEITKREVKEYNLENDCSA